MDYARMGGGLLRRLHVYMAGNLYYNCERRTSDFSNDGVLSFATKLALPMPFFSLAFVLT